jgi:hypothetical protein
MRSLAVLVVIAAAAHAGPRRYPLPAVPSLRALSTAAAAGAEPMVPRCFAYSVKEHAFACIGHSWIYNTENIGADDQATNVRVDLVSPARQESWTIAAIGGRPITRRAIVEAELGALGMQPLRGAPIVITANQWTKVGAARLFLRVEAHEGDASFENFGDLTLRCKSGIEIRIDLRAWGFKLGETARAFRSPDSNWLALSIVGVDGGEDTSQFSLDTAVIDIAQSCVKHSVAMWTSTSSPSEE